MGRLKRKLVVKKAKKYKKWLLLALGLIILACAIGVYRAKSQAGLLHYANAHGLNTGVELVDGNGQIYYEYKGKRHFVTNDDKNHQSPRASGSYIVWLDETNGEYQVVLYSLETRQQLNLSVVGSNTSPSISDEKVAWQGVTNGKAVIYYFTGSSVRLISGAYPAIRPFVQGDQVLFAQKRSDKLWQTVLYDSKTGKSNASQASWPRFEDGKIDAALKGSANYYY